MGPRPGSREWRELVVEDVVEPDLPIVDAHHHLWPAGGPVRYGLGDLQADAASGHRIVATVFVECGAAYRSDGLDHLRPVGETAFVADTALSDPFRLIRGIVAHADLTRPDLDDLLDRHETAGRGLFRGIRDALARAEEPEALMIPGRALAGKHADPSFRAGVARLGERGLTYDTWHYHHQNAELLELARAVPGTVMVLDHFGTPLGVGRYVGRRAEVFDLWRRDMAELARCENVVAKLGGLAMPDNGFGWHLAARPPTSDEVVEAQRPYYEHTIECFGPARCMFESNFPVDRRSLSYRTLWNAFKKMATSWSENERAELFVGTATRIYGLEV